MFDFARCQRPDGSTYGSRGKCKKGKPVSSVEKPGKIAVVPPKADIREMLREMGVKSLNPDQKKVFRKILSAKETKGLGRIVRKLEDGYMEDSIGKVSIGFIRLAKKQMKSWLEANQRSGVGAAAEKRKGDMSPEELRRARTAEAIRRGIQAGVVRAR